MIQNLISKINHILFIELNYFKNFSLPNDIIFIKFYLIILFVDNNFLIFLFSNLVLYYSFCI